MAFSGPDFQQTSAALRLKNLASLADIDGNYFLM
jgi:hypothetical protein